MKRLWMTLGVVGAVVWLAAPAMAQDYRGRLQGQVMDDSRGALPGVTVILSNNATGVTSDRVNVRVSGLPPTTDGQFYEMWLLGADKQLVGLGSFRVGEDGTATLKLPLPVNPDQFSYFDISLEPGDGNPGHSGVSVLRGPTV